MKQVNSDTLNFEDIINNFMDSHAFDDRQNYFKYVDGRGTDHRIYVFDDYIEYKAYNRDNKKIKDFSFNYSNDIELKKGLKEIEDFINTQPSSRTKKFLRPKEDEFHPVKTSANDSFTKDDILTLDKTLDILSRFAEVHKDMMNDYGEYDEGYKAHLKAYNTAIDISDSISRIQQVIDGLVEVSSNTRLSSVLNKIKVSKNEETYDILIDDTTEYSNLTLKEVSDFAKEVWMMGNVPSFDTIEDINDVMSSFAWEVIRH